MRTRVRLTGLSLVPAWLVALPFTVGMGAPWQISVGFGVTCNVAVVYVAVRSRHGMDHRQTRKLLWMFNGVLLPDTPEGGPAPPPYVLYVVDPEATEDEQRR